MKWNILALLMGMSACALSQQSTVWSEDFSNGIPSNWINEETSGVAQWQYRGPATNPDNTVGTQSLCYLGTAQIAELIESETVDNGFIIFDASYWDNSNLPCNTTNIGTGPVPGPHLATLTIPSIDLTGVMFPTLEFHQYYRNFQSFTRVEMSIAGGEWQSIYQSNLGLGAVTPLDLKTRVILGSAAANQADVRFRFVFDGQYYYWMIDDISVVNLYENDMRLDGGSYGDFDFFAPEHPTGYEEMEYSKYPVELAPLLKFNANAVNNGALAQTDVKLRATVENVNTNEILVQQISTEGFNFQPLGSLELRAGTFQMPAEVGLYRVRYEVSQDQVDADDANDLLEFYFEITEDVYARDKGSVAAVTLPLAGQENTPFEIGTIYHVPNAGNVAYSISVALGPGTSLPTSIYAKLYRAEFGFDLSLTELGSSALTPVLAEQVNEFGEEQLITMEFSSPVVLQDGKAYLAAIGSPNGMNNVYTGLNGFSDLNTSWVRLLPDGGNSQLLSLSRIPIIRLNLGDDIISVDDAEITGEISRVLVFPNPVENILQISSRSDILAWNVSDVTGKLIASKANVHSVLETLNVTDWSEGMYLLSVQTEAGVSVTRFLKK
jgi:hypothetical protein